MKTLLVMSDVHSNYPALQAIETFVRRDRFHRVINAGDLVVYGTFPNETIEWFRKKKNTLSIVGNTDNRVLRIMAGGPLGKPRGGENFAPRYPGEPFSGTGQEIHLPGPDHGPFAHSLS